MLSPSTLYRSQLSVVFGSFSLMIMVFAFSTGFVALAWVSIAFGWVAISYALNGTITNKKNGTIFLGTRIILAPYFLLLYSIWFLQGLLGSEETYHRLVPIEVYLGRYTTDIPDDVTLLVDLTSEFETQTGNFESISVPSLDAVGPGVDELDWVVNKIIENEGMTYLHCASGHGRSGLVAASLLIAERVVETGPEAIAYLKEIRRGVGLSRAQERTLEKWLAIET